MNLVKNIWYGILALSVLSSMHTILPAGMAAAQAEKAKFLDWKNNLETNIARASAIETLNTDVGDPADINTAIENTRKFLADARTTLGLMRDEFTKVTTGTNPLGAMAVAVVSKDYIARQDKPSPISNEHWIPKPD